MPHYPSLKRYAWLSVCAGLVTIGLKATAYVLTGSVGLLSDAIESLVNLVAAFAMLTALSVAEREPTEEHAFGYEKAEYFSSAFEGALILAAAAAIAVAAVPRVIAPQPLTALGPGLALSAVASIVNLAVAVLLLRVAREHRSLTIEADARHLLTDVWTSAGVIVGVGLVAFTGWLQLDALVALAVAANILWTGAGLFLRSAGGLLDAAIPARERIAVQAVLFHYEQTEGIHWHALRTRQAGRRRFIEVHILVPGGWTVHRGHELLERIEADLREALPHSTVFTHLESTDDPASWEDAALDRPSAAL